MAKRAWAIAKNLSDWLELPAKVVNAGFVVLGPPLFLLSQVQKVFESSDIGMFWVFVALVLLWWFSVAILVFRDLAQTFSRRRATRKGKDSS